MSQQEGVPPATPVEWKQQGNASLNRGDLAGALECYRQALWLQPDYADAQYNLSMTLAAMGRLDEAIAGYRTALALDPGSYETCTNLGLLLARTGQAEEAMAFYDRAAELNPHAIEPPLNKGVLLDRRGRHAQALACFERALAIDPDSAAAHYNRGLTLLVQGRLREGFAEHEHRLRFPGWVPHEALRGERWTGQDLHGKTLLIYPEQGFGDMIQFVRYVPQLKARGATVVLVCHRPLKRLLQRFPGIDHVLADGEDLPLACDYHVSIMSLSAALGIDLPTIPPCVAFQVERAADPAIAASTRLKVGIAWAGSPGHDRDAERSIAPGRFARIFDAPGCEFFSFQVDAGAPAPAVDLGLRLTDFLDTARLVQDMDLVVSVDTATAHLAATQGVPTWLLVSHGPDWRWLCERRDSPWYPAVTLYRQAQPGDWDGVLDQVRRDLAALAST